MDGKSCCSPSADRGGSAVTAPRGNGPRALPALCDIPGGEALVGTDRPMIPDDKEGPLKRKRVKPFRMMETAVTNEMFAEFVEDTGFVTEAERFGWSYVFHLNAPGATLGVQGAEWWRRVDGAHWRLVHGPGSEQVNMPDHPVIHISWNDAKAFASWAGGRLPSEAEWEHAARGGLGDVRYPWGDEEPDDTTHLPCNIWQGRFPEQNTGADGYLSTAPAKSFAPNGYGLYNMVGNAWEWTAEPFKLRSLAKRLKSHHGIQPKSKLLKGGSFLCHKSYCYRYRIAARTGTSADTSTAHQGFRLVFSAAR